MNKFILGALAGAFAAGIIVGRITTPWRGLHDRLMRRAQAISQANERHIAELKQYREGA